MKRIPIWARSFVFSLILYGNLTDGLNGAIRTVTLTTDTAASGVPGELRSEVAAASNGDTIQFSAGLTGLTIELDLTTFGPIPITSSNGDLIFDSISTNSNVTISDLVFSTPPTQSLISLTGTSISFQMYNGLPVSLYYSSVGHPQISSSSDTGQFITIKTGNPTASQSTLISISGNAIGLKINPSSSSDSFTFAPNATDATTPHPFSYTGQTILLNPCTVTYQQKGSATLTQTFNTEFVLPNSSAFGFDSRSTPSTTWTFNQPITITGTATLIFTTIAGASTSTINLNNAITGNINLQCPGPSIPTFKFNTGSSVSGTVSLLASGNTPNLNITDNLSISSIDFTAQTGSVNISANKTLTLGSIVGSSTETYEIGSGAQLSIGSDNSSSSIASGTNITGAGTLVKAGSGTLTVNGSYASFTGPTSINGGTLSITASNALGTSGTVTIGASVIFQGAGGGTFGIGNPIIPNSSSTIDVTSGTTMGLSGVISGADGLYKTGAGTLRLSGNNTYTGLTTVTAGTLRLDPASPVITLPGDALITGGTLLVITFDSIENTSSITISGGTFNVSTATIIGSLTFNSGTLTTLASETLTLASTGTALTMRDTTISTPLVLSGASGGSVVFDATNNGTATISSTLGLGGQVRTFTIDNGSATTDMQLSGVVSNGGITKEGLGLLLLSNSGNTFAGATTISAGTLSVSAAALGSSAVTIGGSGTLQGSGGGTFTLTNATTLSSGSTIDVTSGTSMTMSGVLSGGSGTLTKTSAGTLILSNGSNSYGGTTTVSAGTLQLNAAGAFPSGNALAMNGGTFAMNNNATTVGTLSGSSGTITTGGAAVLTVQSSSGTYSGGISGVGSLTKSTSGTLTLGGTTSLASMTATGGTLVMNGTTTLTGDLTVNAGATLKGTGTITANLVTVSGTTAPGNSIGTLNIVGDYTQAAGSTYQNELDPTSTDLLIVTGTVDLTASPTLQIIVLPGTYLAPNTYTIIQAGVVNGMFGPIIISDPSFSATVSYPGTSVVLNLVPLAFATRGLTGNPQIVATALDAIGASGGADLDAVIGVLQLLPSTSALESALNQLHPANLNGFAIVQEVNTTNLTSLLSYRFQPIYNPCCGTEDKYVFWTDALGDYLTQGSRYLFPGYSARTWGFLSGFDIKVTKRGLFGLLGGYTSSTVWWRHHFDNGLMNSGYGGVYGGFSVPYFYLDMAAVGSYVSFDATRKISFLTISRHAHSRHHGYGIDGHLEMGFLLGSCNEIRPFGSADFNFLHEQGYTETGASGLNLVVRKRNSTYLKSQGGLIYTRCINLEESRLVPEAGISYVHEQRYQGRYTYTKFVDTTVPMKIHNVNPNRDLISFLAGIRWIFKQDLASMALFYNGEFGSHYTSQLGSFELKIGF